MNENAIRYFPLDFDNLNKGDEISTEQIEEFGRCNRQHQRFRLVGLRLAKKIETACRERGKLLRARLVKFVIRVLTDEEAAIFDAENFKRGRRKQVRALRRLLEVNPSNLTALHQREHERNLLVFGKELQAARSARSAINAIPHKRTTPGLPAKT
jgi:hypothetical protein